MSQPSEKHRVTQVSFIRRELNWATRLPNRSWETVTGLCSFTAQGASMSSSSLKTTSDGTPRMAEVMGATMTVNHETH